MSPYALVVVSLAVLSVYLSLAQSAGLGYAQEVIDKNNFYNDNRFSNRAFNSQRRNSKSMSFMEYLFPMSRNAKVSNNFPQDRSDHGITGTIATQSDDKEETTIRIQSTSPISDESYTIDEGRATVTTRKGTTSGKKKGSLRLPSTTPKTKASSKVTYQSTWASSSVSNKATTIKPVTKQGIDKSTTTGTTSQHKTTHKHYTVYPSVITTKINPPSSSLKNKQTESTTSAVVTNNDLSSQSEPTSEHKVTLSDLAKVSESVTKQSVESENSVDNNKDLDGREGDLDLREKPQKHNVQIVDDTKKEGVPLPDGSTSVLAKPTKYHYYPHNQHIYLLPECAIQQVCNAVYVRLNYTQPLCACPARHRDPCSASLNADDQHTTQLTTDSKKKYASKAITLVKTCEAVTEMRECRAPRDWSLLALQNIRTGKSHYLVICRCPEEFTLEGPMSHDQPTYASVPGIRVYGMMCVQSLRQSTQGYVSVTARPSTPSYQVSYSQPHYNNDGYTRYPGYIGPGVYYNRMARSSRHIRSVSSDLPPIPWDRVKELVNSADWEN